LVIDKEEGAFFISLEEGREEEICGKERVEGVEDFLKLQMKYFATESHRKVKKERKKYTKCISSALFYI
jgi:hypothetical protein